MATKQVDSQTVVLTDDNKEKIKKKVYDESTQTKSLSPKYIKPVYFVDSPSPYLKIMLRQPQYTSTGELISYELVNLFESSTNSPTDESEVQNNYVKSFKYDVLGDSAGDKGSIQIDLEDADQSLAEYFTLKMFTLATKQESPPILEITFGWSSPDGSYNAEYDGKPIFYTQTITCIFIDMESKYIPNTGSVQLTITATPDPEVEHLFDSDVPTPYGVLRSEPGTAMVMEGLFATIQGIAEVCKVYPVKKNEEGKTPVSSDKQAIDISKFIASCTTYFYAEDVCVNIEAITIVLLSVLNFYYKGSLPGTITEEYIMKVVKAQIETLQQKVDYATKHSQPVDKLKSSLVDGITKSITYLKTPTEDANNLTYLTTEYVLALFIKESNIIYSESTDKQAEYKLVKNLTTSLNPVAREVYIHPAQLLEKVQELFRTFAYKNSKAIELSFVDLINMYPQGICTKHDEKTNIFTLDKSKFTGADKKVWGIQAGNYRINPSTTWDAALNQLYSSIYVKLTAQGLSTENIDKFKSLVEENKVSKIEQTKTSLGIPLQLQCKSSYKTTASAKSTINKYKKTYQYILDSNIATPNQNGMKKTLESLQAHSATIDGWSEHDSSFITIVDFLEIAKAFTEGPYLNDSVVQAYSIGLCGTNKALDDYSRDNYNFGNPTIWDIDFPDVIEFTPAIDLMGAMRGLDINAKLKSGLKKDNESVDTEEAANLKKTPIPVTEDYESLARQYVKRSEITFDTDMKDVNQYSGGTISSALQYKKRMQTMRQHILVQALGISGELKVIGDASLTIEDIGGAKIFLKVLNVDGNLSIYTGLYIIQGITHEVSNGSFTTSLSVMKDWGTELISAMQSNVFEKDKLVVA